MKLFKKFKDFRLLLVMLGLLLVLAVGLAACENPPVVPDDTTASEGGVTALVTGTLGESHDVEAPSESKEEPTLSESESGGEDATQKPSESDGDESVDNETNHETVTSEISSETVEAEEQTQSESPETVSDETSDEGGETSEMSDDTAAGESEPQESDAPSEEITRAPIITLPSLDPDETEEAEPEETLPYDPSLHPGNADDYDGVMISAVYGTGKKNTDAVMESGFVQLYNASMYTVPLKGASLYYKSDGASPFEQFVFPEDATIAPGGYYLVKCESVSGYDQSMAVIGMEYYDAEWDVIFDNHEIRLLLAPSGWAIGRDENILLFDDAISAFVATESYNDSVYAVDGMSKNKIAIRTALKEYSGYHTVNISERATGELQKAAPAASGGRVNPVIATRLNEVTFSQPAGVYNKAFNLSLTAKSGYKIYYTTDGSDPTVNGKQYTGAIQLKNSASMIWGSTTKAWANMNGNGRPTTSTQPGGYVIKAYATNGTESTPVYTNTYFIVPNLCDYGVTVMSISLPVDQIIGSEGFYNNFLLTGSITGGRRRGTAIMEVFDPNGERVGNSTVELAVSGNGSSNFAMKSLRVYYKGHLNEEGGREGNLDYDLFKGLAKDQHGQVITTFDRLLLRNSGNDCGVSYIRDAYMQRVCAGLNVDTMASASTLVFLNGEFWGVYNIRERYSPEYVESHYGVDKENVAVIESDYSQVHTNTYADYVVSSGIEGDADPFNALTAYMKSHDLSDPEAYAYVCSQMDIDSFIDMWVTRLFFVARDWPENNIKVWRNRNPEDPSGFNTKWHFTLLDMDMGLSFYDFTTEHENFFWAITNSGSVCGQMMRDLLKNPDFKEQFILRYYEIVNDHLTADYLSAEFEAMVAERDPLMPLQDKRWNDSEFSIGAWNNAVSRIRSFVQNRQSIALSHMYSFFGITEADIENLSYRRVTVSYNPDRVTVYVNGEPVSNGTQFRFEDAERTFEVSVTVKEGYTLNGIVWEPNSGNGQREDTATKATFKVTSTGTISIYAKRDKSASTDTEGQLVAGPTYTFYLTGTGELYAWGDNRNGVLALNKGDATVATPAFVMNNVAKVDTTQGAAYENGDLTWMTAILTKDGKLYTVGANTCGQLGRNGTTADAKLAVVPFNGKIVDVSVGYDHMLIIDDKGVMWGIGSNSNGQMGATNQGGTTQTFQKIAENVAMISAGRRSTVYVDDNGKLYGLGDNRWKKLSQKHGDVITTPVLMMENVTYIASGEHQMLAVTESGDLYYAGWREFNSFVQGGGNNPTMRKVMGGVEKADIYFGNLIILTENGDAYAYGLNTDGGLGNASITGGTTKKIYSGVTDVAAGYGFTVFYCEDGAIRVLGDNTYGQGGTGKAGGRVNFDEVDV